MDDKKLSEMDMYLLKRLDSLEKNVVHEIATLKADAKKSGAKHGSIYAVVLSIAAALLDRFIGH